MQKCSDGWLKCVAIAALAVTGFVAGATDYTWTGGAEGDGESWYNPTNWGKTAVNDYPKSTSDKAIFPANADVTVAITNDIKVYQVNFNAGCSFTLKGVAANGVVPQLTLNNNFSDSGVVKFKLDHAYFYRNGGWTPKAGCSFELVNGAKLYLSDFYLTTMDSVSLSGGSWMSVNQFFINGKTRTLTIDDSTLEVRSHCFLGNANPGGGRIVFKGAHPLLRAAGVFRSNNNAAGMTDKLRFDFEVPRGGFAEVPLQAYGEKAMNGQGNPVAGYLQFAVLPSSPALAAGGSLDFCAYLNPRGMVRSKMSNGDEATSALRFTDGTPDVAASSDDTATGIYLTLGEGAAQTPAEHSGALLNYNTTAVSRHVITATTRLTALATNGDTTRLELWAGEENNAATMTLADSSVPTAIGANSLVFTAPEAIGEKTYYFQFRLFDTTGSATNFTASTSIFNVATKDSTVYTWKAKDGDWTGDWNDPSHWDSDFTTADGYPHTANATAKFPRGKAIAVTINDNYTVGTLDFTDYNPDDVTDAINVTFVGAEGEEYGTNKVLTASTLSINAFGGEIVLDRAAVKVSNETNLGAKRKLLLKNGAWLYCGTFNSKSGGTFAVTDGSYASLGSMLQENKGSTLIIDNATLNLRGNLTHATANVTSNGGEVYFRGDNPAMIFDAGQCINHRANGAYTMVYTFTVPKGGYAVAPIRAKSATGASVDFPNYYGANFLKFGIDPKSPCFEEVATFDTPIVDWRNGSKVVLSTGKNIFGELPDGGYFAYGTTTSGDWGWTDVAGFSGTAKSIGAHIVSAAHASRLTVTGDAGVTVEGTVPAFGESEMGEGEITFSSPATYMANGVRYTCTGCTLTEIEKTAAGSTRTPTEHTGVSFAYTPCGKEVEVVWHYAADYAVTATAINDANGTVALSGDGHASATKPVTLTASTTSEDMEFQYWYGDLPYADRYTNPLTVSGDKARNITAFFGHKTGGVCTTSGSNGTAQWYDANQWANKIIPGTNDTAVVWSTRDDTQVAQYKRYYQVPSFFAVKNLVASNACILVNGSTSGNWPSAKFDEQGGTYTYRPILVADANRLEPVGCDIFGDVTLDCYKATAQNNGAILYVGGQNQQCYSKVNIYGNLTVTDGSVEIAAGYPIPSMIDATKAIDGPDGFLPFTHLEEFFRGGNVLCVHGKTTLRSPIGTKSLSTIHVMNEFRTGVAVWLDLQDVEVQAGAEITANYGGYGKFDSTGAASGRSYSMCPGGHCTGDNTSGGSYGGAGGSEDTTSYPVQKPTTHMATYGYETAPFYPGGSSGGDGGCDCRGGGSIRLDCKTLDLDGGLLAQAKFSTGNSNKGGAAGGGIWVVCEEFNPGLDCIIKAEGGNSSGPNAGGGGGRVAICEGLTAEQVLELFETEDHLATDATVSSLADKLGARLSVAGGTGTTSRSNGYPGTGVYIVNTAGKKTMTVMGDPVNMGEPTPGYGPQVFDQNQVIELAGPVDAYVLDDNRSRRDCIGYTITDMNGGVLVDSDLRTGSYTITQDCILTWKLTKLVHKLGVEVTDGGSVATNAIDVADDEWQGDGTTVTLTAVADNGHEFIGWYGELPTNLQTAATLSFPQTKGRTVKACFATTAAGEALWTGEGDGTSWEDASNWSIGAVPGANSDVVLTNKANVTAAMCVPISVKSLRIDSGATLSVIPNGTYSTYSKPRVKENAVETDWQRSSLTVSGDMTVGGTFTIGGKFSLSTIELTVGGNLAFGEGAKGNFYAAYNAPAAFFDAPTSRYATNQVDMVLASGHVDGGFVTVGGTMTVATNAVVAPWCDFLSGASPRFDVGALTVAEGGKIDADGKGWGYTVYSSLVYSFSPTLRDANTGGYAGGTYAGVGGYADSHSPSFNVYGWALAPLLPGGPGFNTSGAPGGGVVRIHATGTIKCFGSITAVGGNTSKNGNGYCGAGGGIFLTGRRFKSADTTVISAEGSTETANDNHGAGAGGRVAIGENLSVAQLAELYATGALTGANLRNVAIDVLDGPDAPIADHAQGVVTARGGINNRTYIADRRYYGEDGTVRWLQGAKPGLIIILK